MKTLMDYLPEYYAESMEVRVLQEGIQPDLETVWEGREDLLLQLSPNTATWGLCLWEQALGLTVDETKDTEFRRTRVVSKIRGRGTTTAGLIKSVAESFSNGEVEVYEVFAENRLEIHFVGKIGLPPNMEDLQNALNDIIPAHLAWEFVITYRTHEGLQLYTHEQLAAHTNIGLKEDEIA